MFIEAFSGRQYKTIYTLIAIILKISSKLQILKTNFSHRLLHPLLQNAN